MQTLYDFCVENGREALLAEWDAERNAPITPQTISYGSKQKLWWRCKNNHLWQTAVYSRSNGSGCPYCAGKRVLPETSLAARYPWLAGQWDEEKNSPIQPEMLSPGSHRVVWWRCEQGHTWRAAVKSRVSGNGCPYCAGRKVLPEENSLAVTDPSLAAQWDREKNGEQTPWKVSRGSRYKAWWRCEQGHSWQAAVCSRTGMGTGCPICGGKTVQPGFNDLASQFPALAQEWDWEKNGVVTPETVHVSSQRQVWWRCPLGHSYRTRVDLRSVKCVGCPYCAGKRVLPGFNDLATREPKIAAQWHPTLNGTLSPKQVTAGSHRKVWWECSCGHIWKARIGSRTGKAPSGCPICAGNVNLERSTIYRELEWSPERNRSSEARLPQERL